MADTNIEQIAAGLPIWMPRGPETDNYKLLKAVGDSLDRMEQDMRDVQNAIHPQNAGTLGELQKLGIRMGVTLRTGESKESYRARIIGRHQALTCGGSDEELLGNMAIILNTDVENITFGEMTEPGTVPMSIPGEALTNLSLSAEDVESIINAQTAAGYRVILSESGSLRYITEAQYNAADYDSTKGYDEFIVVSTDDFTEATLPAGWAIGGSASYDDVNDRIELTPNTTNLQGNAVYTAGLGGRTNWEVFADAVIDGTADEVLVNFYADDPGTGKTGAAGYFVEFDHFNEQINVYDHYAATTLASVSVDIPDTAATNTFRVRYDNGLVRVLMNGVEILEVTISTPDYTNDGLSVGARTGGSAALHALDTFELRDADVTGEGGTYGKLL